MTITPDIMKLFAHFSNKPGYFYPSLCALVWLGTGSWLQLHRTYCHQFFSLWRPFCLMWELNADQVIKCLKVRRRLRTTRGINFGSVLTYRSISSLPLYASGYSISYKTQWWLYATALMTYWLWHVADIITLRTGWWGEKERWAIIHHYMARSVNWSRRILKILFNIHTVSMSMQW